MRLHYKFRGEAVFLRDSGFVQQKNPVDRWQRSSLSKVIFYQSSVFLAEFILYLPAATEFGVRYLW
ncbi:hypothetical protein BMR05_04620 [Methylococcaceae bacterium HT4]|nr:hypothetical protein BMR05_04620 [Methylococcaceae bacterium HT4]